MLEHIVEQMKPIYRYSLLSGIALWGILMTLSVFYDELRSLLGYFGRIIHVPAGILLKLWGYSGIPPYGDAGFIMIPVMVGVQWLIILVAVFFITRKRHPNGKTSDNE